MTISYPFPTREARPERHRAPALPSGRSPTMKTLIASGRPLISDANSPASVGSPPALVVLALLVVVLGSVAGPVTAQSTACEGPQYRDLDFWLGSWRLLSSQDQEVATSEVVSRHGGCALFESFRSGELSGTTLVYFDPAASLWRLVGVDSAGRSARAEGQVDAGRFLFTGRHVEADGSTTEMRRTLERDADGGVRLRFEESTGSGGWQVTFEGVYVPGDRPPSRVTDRGSPATEPAPSTSPGSEDRRATDRQATDRRTSERQVVAPDPQPVVTDEPAPTSGQVIATSRRADLSTFEAGRAQVQMESPMTLRLPLGPIEKLSRGYAWSSSDTAPFVCRGAAIHRVRVSKDERGKKVRVGVELALHSSAFSQRVDLETALVDIESGDRIGAGSLEKVPIGRGTTAQASDGFVTRDLVIELDREVFESAFTDDARPELELTLTLR